MTATLKEYVERAKKKGYTVHFRHHRQFHKDLTVNPRGGATECLLVKQGKKYVGVSRASDADNFNRRVGSMIALQRAIRQTGGKW